MTLPQQDGSKEIQARIDKLILEIAANQAKLRQSIANASRLRQKIRRELHTLQPEQNPARSHAVGPTV